MNKAISTLLASAMLTSTELCGQEMTVRPLDSATVNRIADAIFRCENSQQHPYGVMIPTKDPRRVCINTINHAWVDFGREIGNGYNSHALKRKENEGQVTSLRGNVGVEAVSLPFISFLGRRYCPPSVDSVGYHNWTNNVFRILNHK